MLSYAQEEMLSYAQEEMLSYAQEEMLSYAQLITQPLLPGYQQVKF